MRRALPFWLPPLIGLALFAIWLPRAEIERLDLVPSRDQTFITGPYALAIMVGFVLVIAVSTHRPTWALALLTTLLVLQIFFWPARFSQIAWTGYLALAVVPALISRSGRTTRRPLMLAITLAASIAVGSLLTLPALSVSGEWGTITGKDVAGSLDATAIWTAVALLVTVLSWRIGRPRPAPSVSDHDRAEDRGHLISDLSPREREMFELVATGRSNAEIAASSYIGETTVKTHVSSILAKLGLSSRSELIAFAWSNGLLPVAEMQTTSTQRVIE